MSQVTIESLTEAKNMLPLQALFYSEGCQSHLDLGSNDGRTLRGLDKSTLTAVDLFAPSVAKMRKNGITAHCRDIREFVADAVSHHQHWDRVTSFDVIEHIPRADGEKLLDQIELITLKEIVVFMPIETPELESTEKWNKFREEGLNQHPSAQRELHAHQSRWSPEDFSKRGYITLMLPNFHYEGFGAFFAAKYRNPVDQAAALKRMQEYAASLAPKQETWGYFGANSRIVQPLLLNGIDRIFVGDNVNIGYGARIEAIKSYSGIEHSPTLVIGDGTTAEFFLHIGCAQSVKIGRDCLIAGNVSITDHEHGYDCNKLLHGQPLTVATVEIGDSVFIGEGVHILPGVKIGEHALIGSHAVVTKNVPAGAVVAGVPAKILDNTRTRGNYVPRIYIAIPSIDEKSLRVQECLASIKANTVNDAAKPGYISYMAHVFEDVNRTGFAATCNRALASKLAQEADYVLLLNDDTIVTPSWLSSMLAVMEHYPEVGLVGPCSDAVSGPQCREPIPGPISQEVQRLVGFCLLIRRSVIDTIGGIDEAYTLGWYTDDDYTLRALAAGFKARIALDSFVHHEFGASYGEANIKMQEADRQGWEVFSSKWAAERRPNGYAVQIPDFDLETCFIPLNSEPMKAVQA